jgi:hypothetical protein
MHIKKAVVLIAICIFLSAVAPPVASATILTVSKSCSAGSTTCFTTIGGAISFANPTTSSDSIVILPGTYSEQTPIVFKDNLPIRGVDTSSTVIQSNGAGPLFSGSELSNISLSNVTLDLVSGTGIQATNSTLNLTNNIFRGNGTPIVVQNTARVGGTIDHNTFFQYTTAVSSNVDLVITNNIFYGTGTSIALAVLPGTLNFTQFASVNNNDFFNNQIPANNFYFDNSSQPAFIAHDTNIPNLTITNADPLFVHPTDTDQTKLDYHVMQGSPTLGTGTGTPGSDMGAFGGSGADTIPFPVEIVSLATISPQTTARISWTQNLAWNVTNTVAPGSYDITYQLNTASTTTVNVPAPALTTDIPGLAATPPTPGAPILAPAGFADQTLILTWMPGVNATSYTVHVRDTVTGIQSDIPVGNVNTLTVPGLVNGRNYDVWITPYAQSVYTFAVFVRDNSGGPFQPGVAHESMSSPVRSLTVGAPQAGPDSNTITAFPEPIAALPNLPNSGCFIATAAFGYYSAPQVQILRDFRDRYLLTNRAGRAFVAWYYRYGPIGAEFINAHPWTKPAVRIALLPFIGAALFMIKASVGTKLSLLIGCGFIAAVLLQRKNIAGRGGTR